MTGHMDQILYHKKAFSGGFQTFVAHFSTTAKLLWTKPGRNVGTASGFINPENQDDWSHIILWISYYRNRFCVCLCVHPFYFKCLFQSNYWAGLNQSWQVGGYTIPEYESQKVGWLRCTALGYVPLTGSACFLATPGRLPPNLAHRLKIHAKM